MFAFFLLQRYFKEDAREAMTHALEAGVSVYMLSEDCLCSRFSYELSPPPNQLSFSHFVVLFLFSKKKNGILPAVSHIVAMFLQLHCFLPLELSTLASWRTPNWGLHESLIWRLQLVER